MQRLRERQLKTCVKLRKVGALEISMETENERRGIIVKYFSRNAVEKIMGLITYVTAIISELSSDIL